MSHIVKHKQALALSALALAILALAVSSGAANAPAVPGDKGEKGDKKDLTKATWYGVSTCTKCHTEPTKVWPTDLVKLNEYAHWRVKDRHSLAFAALEGPRGRQMEKLLGFKVTESAMCLNCHGASFKLENPEQDFTRKEGVGCVGCHGPAGFWMNMHFLETPKWRAMTPEDKEALGMFNVRDPMKRSQLCLSCHIGNAAEGKIVTHSMYAAGHPPLSSFEVASQSANLPPHWYTLREVKAFTGKSQLASDKQKAAYHWDTRDFEQTKLVLASNKAAMEAAAWLMSDRADFASATKGTARYIRPNWPPLWLQPGLKDDPHTLWPELEVGKNEKWKLSDNPADRWPEIMMTHAECYACHHDLKNQSWRQVPRGYSGKQPGRPQFQEWPYALSKTGISDAIRQDYNAGLESLYRACDKPFGDPGLVIKAAKNLDACAGKLPSPVGGKDFAIDKAFASKLLQQLSNLPKDYYPDYDSARQIAWAFNAVYTDGWNDKQDPKVLAVLKELDDAMNLTRNSKIRQKTIEDRDALGKQFNYGNPEDPLATTLDANKDLLQKMLAVNERESVAAMQCAADYNPIEFRERMSKIAGLLK
jgi:hypothetical protein